MEQENLEYLKVKDLQGILKDAKLPIYGKKSILIERIIKNKSGASNPSTSDASYPSTSDASNPSTSDASNPSTSDASNHSTLGAFPT